MKGPPKLFVYFAETRFRPNYCFGGVVVLVVLVVLLGVLVVLLASSTACSTCSFFLEQAPGLSINMNL